MKEWTIYYPIGELITIDHYNDIEPKIRSLIDELTDNYVLSTDDNGIKGPLIKYGILDLTFKERGFQYLKVFGKGKELGYVPQSKKADNFNADDLQEYLSKYMNDIDSFFPIEIEIVDCCKTDNEWVWSEKYLYS
ncbi:hypothetical protein SAMN05421823_10781 [Catalinimonas alkaloidigena]|uniref:Uncharacterized protein n=1 Tax=Catalinimonas alkaloidigena TaxID=1075417 RepID=A0A1G9LL26_9BACT|nr:hypothetical protein [Catalinimonas alkaloidigena]SDL62523.1 hypothetical protein SAMN05421823_10781 [Catalinimonas alkaloidigena]